MKGLASVVTLSFLSRTLIWDQMAFLASNYETFRFGSIQLKKTLSKNIYQYSFLYAIYHCLL